MASTTFEQAMMRGDSAAWEGDWGKAIEAYMLAVREMPTSTLACNSLGYALYQAGRLDDALKVYGQASKLDPADPLPIEKSADVLERMGRAQDAARQYIASAEMYLAQRDLERAIENWSQATRLTPGLVKIHQKLAAAYERLGQRPYAVTEYLKMAFSFQAANKNDLALQALERAQRLDAKDSRVLNALTAVRSNKAIQPELLELPPDVVMKNAPTEADFPPPEDIPDAHPDGPRGEAVEHAFAVLAVQVFESGMMMDLGSSNAIQGIEYHRASGGEAGAKIIPEAVGAYQRAIAAGFKPAPLVYNLGALLLAQSKPQDALQTLYGLDESDPVLAAGLYHVRALAYIALSKWKEAAQALLKCLHYSELAMPQDETSRAELETAYKRAHSLTESSDPIALQSFSRSIAERLTGADWQRRITQTRQRLVDMMADDPKSALEAIAKGEFVIEAMNRVDQYLNSRRYVLAMDESQYILEREPDYLAAHQKIAQILMEVGRVEDAIEKYNYVARTYLLRGDQAMAAKILNEAIKVAPADVNIRTNLIELLEAQERWDEVIDQYIGMGKTYRELLDFSNARTAYDQALKVAQRTGQAASKTVEIMHGLGDIDLERMDLRGALRTYQKICELRLDDEKARLKLVDLNYRLNNAAQGIKEIDQLLQLYARQKRPDLILKVLEEYSTQYPNDMGLRVRLGTVYQQMGRIAEAVKHFEELGNLQLNAGLQEEAKQTIRRIIALNPPKVELYQQLLHQIGG